MAAVKGKWVTHRRFVPSIEKALRVVEQSMLDELSAGGVIRVADVQWPPHYNPLSTEKATTIRVEPLPAPLGATTVDAFDEGVQASLMYALVELGAVVSTTVELLIEDRDRVAVASSPRLTIVEVEDKERGEIGFFGELHFSTVTRKTEGREPKLSLESDNVNEERDPLPASSDDS